jgi:hypothetical protein
MLSQIVGPVNFNSACVLAVGFVCACIVITSLIIKRRSLVDVTNEFELAKMKQQAENDRAMFQVETDRAFKFKQIDQNLITSHAREE